MRTCFVVLGIVFSRGKGASLIAGYNTTSREEKARYDEKALCRFMSRLMFVLAGCYALIALGTALEHMILVWIGFGLMLAVVLFAVIYMNTANRFKRR